VTRALVLGGGGLTGLAWEAGLLTGLAETGVDVRGWDRVVGTSAGAFVGAYVTAGRLPDLIAVQVARPLDAEVRALAGRLGPSVLRLGRRRGMRWVPAAWLGGRAARAAVATRVRGTRSGPTAIAHRPWEPVIPGERRTARLGSLAIAARTSSEARYRATVSSLLDPIASEAWPPDLVVTAVDAHDGSLICLDGSSGIPLVDAVAASAALPILFPPVTIRGRRYIDGGMRSATNMTLAGRVDEALVLVPIHRGQLDDEALALRRQGTDVRLVLPDADARRALGMDLQMLDPERRAAAVEAGRRQGTRLGRSWSPAAG
jgi:NTE family protein